MIDASDNYIEAALSPGREVNCRIAVGANGDRVFRDADIISFSLDDTCQTEDKFIGNACAVRFLLELKTNQNINKNAKVIPFISFGGGEETEGEETEVEEYQLGQFFVANKIRKNGKLTLTCYDKMYWLDKPLNYTAALRACGNTADLLDYVIARITPEQFMAEPLETSLPISKVPSGYSARGYLGFIAGAFGGNIKYNRFGDFEIKYCDEEVLTITRDNYMDLSLSEDEYVIHKVEMMNTDGDTFTIGNGGAEDTATLRCVNPLASNNAAISVISRWYGRGYYAGELRMQGLPFLRSGDRISVQNMANDEYHSMIISEYSLRYDGGLTAIVRSLSNAPTDPPKPTVVSTGGGDEDPPTYMYVRPTQFQISYQGQGLVDATFTVTKPCIVNFLASANVYNESPDEAATVSFRVLLTGGAPYPNDTYTDFLTLYDRVEPNDFLSFSRADATYLAYPGNYYVSVIVGKSGAPCVVNGGHSQFILYGKGVTNVTFSGYPS